MTDEPNLSGDDILFLSWGLIYRTVCAPNSISDEEISEFVSKEDPPGTSFNRWVVSDPEERDDMFDGVNRIPCPDCAKRSHVLMNC